MLIFHYSVQLVSFRNLVTHRTLRSRSPAIYERIYSIASCGNSGKVFISRDGAQFKFWIFQILALLWPTHRGSLSRVCLLLLLLLLLLLILWFLSVQSLMAQDQWPLIGSLSDGCWLYSSCLHWESLGLAFVGRPPRPRPSPRRPQGQNPSPHRYQPTPHVFIV